MVEQKHPLGLSHNPFASPQGGFFDGGDRRTYLEQLRHLSQWSRRVLLVTGPRDAGKTMMFRQLSASLEPRAKAARINAALINAPREVLAAVVQGFGLAAPADAHSQLLMDVLVAHVEDQESHQRFCVILVDDAEVLDSRAVEQLLILVSRCPVRLVMFGDLRIAPLVERAARNLEVSWHELRLSGFSLNDVRSYLEWRFKQARYRGRLPFTEDQVKDIARLSDGMPGRINQMANVLLAKLQSGEVEPERPRFPVLHRGIVAVLLVLMVLAYLLVRPPATDAPTEVEPVALPAPSGPGSGAEESELQGSGAEIAGPQSPERPMDEAAALPRPPGTAEAAPAAGDPEPDRAPAPVATAADAPESAGAAPTPTASATAPAAAPAAPSSPEPAARVGARASSGPADGPAPASGPKDASWILRQPAGHFTLQLLSSGSAERAAAYVAERRRPEDFAVYRIRRDGKLLHVVVYGAFSSRDAAERAARSPEATAGGVKPWLRTFEQVQEAVRSTPQR